MTRIELLKKAEKLLEEIPKSSTLTQRDFSKMVEILRILRGVLSETIVLELTRERRKASAP